LFRKGGGCSGTGRLFENTSNNRLENFGFLTHYVPFPRSLSSTATIDENAVKARVALPWDLTITVVLKVSQNTRFQVVDGSQTKFIVLAAPSPSEITLRGIRTELHLLQFLHHHDLTVCPRIQSKSGELIAICAGPAMAVFAFAIGDCVIHTDMQWLRHGATLGRDWSVSVSPEGSNSAVCGNGVCRNVAVG
jgi:hypothetical protein